MEQRGGGEEGRGERKGNEVEEGEWEGVKLVRRQLLQVEGKRWLFTEGLQSLTARRKIRWLTRNASINTSFQMEWTTLENRERSCSAVAVQKHTS